MVRDVLSARRDRARVEAPTEDILERALERRWDSPAGELACWRRRAGIEEEAPQGLAEPYGLQLAGEWERAAAVARAGLPVRGRARARRPGRGGAAPPRARGAAGAWSAT